MNNIKIGNACTLACNFQKISILFQDLFNYGEKKSPRLLFRGQCRFYSIKPAKVPNFLV